MYLFREISEVTVAKEGAFCQNKGMVYLSGDFDLR